MNENQKLETQGLFHLDGRFMRSATVGEYMRSLWTGGRIVINDREWEVRFIGAEALAERVRGA